jgi:hypothetical protein
MFPFLRFQKSIFLDVFKIMPLTMLVVFLLSTFIQPPAKARWLRRSAKKNMTQESTAQPSPTEEKESKELDITSDTLVYDDTLEAYILTGNVHMMVKDQNAVLDADKVTYQPSLDVLVAEGNIKLTKNGDTTEAAYLRMRLDGQTVLVNDNTVNLGMIRLRAKTTLGRSDLTHLKDGAIILVPRETFGRGVPAGSGAVRFVGGKPSNGIVLQAGYVPHIFNSKRTQRFVDADNLRANPMAEAQEFLNTLKRKGVEAEEVELNVEEKPESEFLRLVVKQVDIKQHPDDYYMVDLKTLRLRYKETSVFPLPNIDVGIDKKNGRLDYLGPEIGFNRDLGGLFVNPGFDFKVGPGALKLSPMVSYGQTINRSERSIQIRDPEFSYGVMSSYRTSRLDLRAARNFRNDYNVLFGEYLLFKNSRNTRFIASQNAFAGMNFFTQERPSYGFQLQDNRNFFGQKLFNVNVAHNVGLFKDDFFPFNSGTSFTTSNSNSPVTAGRIRQQVIVANTRPLFKIGNNIELGANLQASNAYYTTGEVVSILRGGPTANVFLGDFLMSQVAYNIGANSGKSPFVFDSFFLGNQTVSLNNAIRIGPYALLGFRQDYNLSNNNARNDALVGNTVYISAGSRNVKFLIGYDTIFKRTQFGVSYYPNTTQAEIAFDDGYLMSAVTPLTPQQMQDFKRWRTTTPKERQAEKAHFHFPWQKENRKVLPKNKPASV